MKAGTDDIRSECRQLFFAFAEKQKAIVEMVSKKANLEDVFIELTEGEANGGLEGGEETDTVGGMGVSQGTAVNSLYETEDIPDGVDAEDALEESEVEKG